MSTTAPASKAITKSALIASIAESGKFTKADVAAVLEALATKAAAELRTNGAFVVPGVVKLKATSKAATEDHEGINPFTKQPTTIKGKPASLKVRATPAPTLKLAVAGTS
jgi:nucleoid DNA-binding protein